MASPVRRWPDAGWRPAASLVLAADLGDFDAAMPFMDRAERRAGLDGLQLLRVADQHELRACSAAWDRTRSIWRVPTMPASSMTSTSRT
jgi:hypothetical protein